MELSNWDGFGDVELGIIDTKGLKSKLGNLLGDDLTVNLNKRDDGTYTSMDLIGGKQVHTAITCELDHVPKYSTLKNNITYNTEIILDDEFVELFLSTKAAYPDAELFTLLMDKKDKLGLIIGYSNINNDRGSVSSIKCNTGKDVIAKPIHFRADHFKEILNANSKTEGAILSVSDEGLATVDFKNTDFVCKYHMTYVDID